MESVLALHPIGKTFNQKNFCHEKISNCINLLFGHSAQCPGNQFNLGQRKSFRPFR